MEPTTLNILLVVAIALGLLSLVLIILGLRPQPKAEAKPIWPPKFYFPLSSDASLLTPRQTQTGSFAMPTLEVKFQPKISDNDDEEPTARQLDLNKISQLADKANSKRQFEGTMPIDIDEITNKNVINPNAANSGKPTKPSDPDATNKQVLK